MVKIEDLTEEEKTLRERENRLFNIAKLFFSPNNKIEFTESRTINIRSPNSQFLTIPPIVIHPDKNTIAVESEPFLQSAIEFAKRYEQSSPGEEITVKKMYE